MQIEDFRSIMNKFQEEGAFTIPEEQRQLWFRVYAEGEKDSLQIAVNEFLAARKDSRTPQPGQLREYYKQAVQKAVQPEDHSAKPKLSPEAVKGFKSLNVPSSAVEGLLNQRAHNLIRRWRGFLGYATDGKIDGGNGQSLGGVSEAADKAIREAYGDVVKAVKTRATQFVAEGRYPGVRVP